MESSARWIIAIIAVLGIVALVAFARGDEARGNPDASPAAIPADMVG
jgi:hypothetical protein